MNSVFITGIAGFIGYHTALKFHNAGWEVWGVDNFNEYYDPDLKEYRASLLWDQGINIGRMDIRSKDMTNYMREAKPDLVIHLAAHAGIRHSLENPFDYIDNNIHGTQCLINSCETLGIDNVIYASTSAVMAGCGLPWVEDCIADKQISPYGYSKLTNEYQFECSKIENATGLRFFTVYGDYGRPDMALFMFTQNILEEKPITVFNSGDMIRDFTHVSDIVEGIYIAAQNMAGREIYCLGSGRAVKLMAFVDYIAEQVGKKPIIEYAPPHPSDANITWANISKISKLGYKPKVSIEEGVQAFVKWYKGYYA
jgi:UDP-glucuronate 4-epimerase